MKVRASELEKLRMVVGKNKYANGLRLDGLNYERQPKKITRNFLKIRLDD